MLTNVDGLSNLNIIGGTLGLYFNELLTNIDGLSGLISVGNINISDNPVLANINGLSGLTTIGGFVSIAYNDVLTNLDGLSALTSVGSQLSIFINPQLSMCCALCALLQADAIDDEVIGGPVQINDNAIGCDVAAILACMPCSDETVLPDIPTLSEWGLIMLGLITLIIGVISIREQRVLRTI